MTFREDFEKVPLDFALCRYLAVEKGLSFMPMSNFCMQESPYKLQNYVRLAICKEANMFTSPDMVQKFRDL